jgi:hypothetical protein
MSTFFPRHSVVLRVEELTDVRKISLSLVEMALLTGIVLRLLHSLWVTNLGTGLLSLVGYYAIFTVVLLGAATLHLGNFTIRRWLWRAPAFAAVEAAAEAAVSLLLIALRREPLGSASADFHDWPSMALETLAARTGTVCAFALLLAGVVQAVRSLLVRRRHRRPEHREETP